jgi:NADPH:quinone reductase-like Zn-dependent oxidoreductase
MIDGSFKVGRVRWPQVLGSEGAGTIRAIGDRVTRFWETQCRTRR